MHGIRVLCYTFIVYAFYGYIAILSSLIADTQGLADARYLAWVDVIIINAAVWLVAFAFIELNVVEWRQEVMDELRAVDS